MQDNPNHFPAEFKRWTQYPAWAGYSPLPVAHSAIKSLLVYRVFQSLARLESWQSRRCNLDRLTGLRVATGACCALFHTEGAKSNQSNRVTFLQRARDAFQSRVQCTASSCFRNVSRSCNSINQFRLIHDVPLESNSLCSSVPKPMPSKTIRHFIPTGRNGCQADATRFLPMLPINESLFVQTHPSPFFYLKPPAPSDHFRAVWAGI